MSFKNIRRKVIDTIEKHILRLKDVGIIILPIDFLKTRQKISNRVAELNRHLEILYPKMDNKQFKK